MRVLKFGGKSLDTTEKCNKICKYIKDIYKNEKQLIIIVSAIGNTTDKLIDLSNSYNYEKCAKKNNLIARRELAKLLTTGEIQSAALLSIMLNSIGIPAKSFSASDIEIRTFGDYLNSKIHYINKSKLNDCLSKNIVCVVSGFQGINQNNEFTTLGRGGSDTTAVALSSIYNLDAEIYSDYDGVFTGDPKLNTYKKIKKIDYNSILKLSKAGAKVLETRSILIAKKYNTTIIAKSSEKPKLNGTIISNIETDEILINSNDYLSKISIVFSNSEKTEEIFKNVIKILNNYKIYNLIFQNNTLEFFINQKDKIIIFNEISAKLKLLK